jgi:chromosome segregation ATPase
MATKQLSRQERFDDALSKVQQGLSELQDIQGELESWRDGLSGTNLESSELYSRLEEASDTLSSANDDIENATGSLDGLEIPSGFRG